MPSRPTTRPASTPSPASPQPELPAAEAHQRLPAHAEPHLLADASPPSLALLAEQEAHARTRAALRDLEAAAARFVPPGFLRLLGAARLTDLVPGDAVERKMTILFSDIRGFTGLCEGMSPRDTFRFINSFLGAMEPVVAAHRGFIDKYIGDAVMALFPGSADDAVAAGVGLLGALEEFNRSRGGEGRPRIRIGVGLNHGMVMLGTVGGGDRLSGTVVSDAVNLAARLEEATRTYGTAMLVSEATLYGLQGAAARQVRFVDRIRVKGKRQPQSIYEIFDADPAPLRAAKAGRRAQFEQAVAAYHLRAPDQALPLLERCLEAAPDDGPARLYLDRCREYLATGRHEGTGELDAYLAWRDEFTLGIAIIDEQHHELLDAMNRLVPHLQAGEAVGGAEVLAFLERYAVEHFGTEEELMRAHGYPFLAEHLVEHANFVDFFARLRRDVQAGRGGRLDHVFQAQVFLLDWFANHSTSTDRHLTRWLRGLGVV